MLLGLLNWFNRWILERVLDIMQLGLILHCLIKCRMFLKQFEMENGLVHVSSSTCIFVNSAFGNTDQNAASSFHWIFSWNQINVRDSKSMLHHGMVFQKVLHPQNSGFNLLILIFVNYQLFWLLILLNFLENLEWR